MDWAPTTDQTTSLTLKEQTGSDTAIRSSVIQPIAMSAPVADMVFNSASLLPSDTMPRVLRDELEGIDFYIAQGYVEIARDTLDRLRVENGEHPEILARYNRLGDGFSSVAPELVEPESTEPVEVEPAELVDGVVLMPELPISEVDDEPEEMLATEFEITVSDDEPEGSEGEGNWSIARGV